MGPRLPERKLYKLNDAAKLRVKKALENFISQTRKPGIYSVNDGSVGGTGDGTDTKRSPKASLFRKKSLEGASPGLMMKGQMKQQTQIVNNALLDDMKRRNNRISNMLNEL